MEGFSGQNGKADCQACECSAIIQNMELREFLPKDFFKKIKKFSKDLTAFDLLIGFLIIGVLIFLGFYLLRQKEWIEVEVKVSQPQWWWDSEAPPYWLVDSIKVGNEEIDAKGEKIAKVKRVKVYDTGADRKDAYLLLDLKVLKNKKSKKMIFKNQPLEIGSPITLNLTNSLINGIVTFIEGIPDEREEKEMIVKVKWFKVEPHMAEAVREGSQIKDLQGKTIAQILEKNIELHKIIVSTDRGDVFVRTNPLRKDVEVKIKLKAKKQKDNFYFQETQNVKVGNNFWLAFPEVNINKAMIMEIVN